MWVSYQGNRKASSDFPLATHFAYTVAPKVRHTGVFFVRELAGSVRLDHTENAVGSIRAKHYLLPMAPHPLHALFSAVNTQKAVDGTTLQRERRCNYWPKAWKLHQYSTGERQGEWRAINFNVLCDHMQQKRRHGNDNILSVAYTSSKDNARVLVDDIRDHGRCWPPLFTDARDQPTVTVVATRTTTVACY